MNTLKQDRMDLPGLREQLRERFPEAHSGRRESGTRLRTGVMELDVHGLSMGSCSEIVAEGPPGRGGLLARSLVRAARDSPLALVDGGDGFDPQSFEDPVFAPTFLWVRCRGAMEAVRAADLLLRDGNIPLVLVDFQLCAERECRRLPSTLWFRLRNLAERSGAAALVLSRFPMVSSATIRLQLTSAYQLEELDTKSAEIVLSRMC